MLFYLSVWAGALLQQLVPFPSWLLFVPAGATLQARHAAFWAVCATALIIGTARVLASLVVYGLSKKLHKMIYAHRHSWFGIKRTHLQRLRTRLGSHGSWWAVFAMWALPVVPSTLIPLSAGFVKIPPRTFVTATYAGSVINALMYLLIGFYGLRGLTWLGS